jgi:hypothetical protein
VNEKALLFGEDKSLVGVVTDPDASARPVGRGVIILNAGVLHRVGPNRLHVQLARALSGDGFVALRFDFSGIGDSRQAGGHERFVRRAAREVTEAMDFLERSRGLSEFVLVGICAGADHGLQASLADSRVRGAVLVDGYNRLSLGVGMVLHRHRQNLLNPRSWFRFVTGRSLTWTALRNLAASRHSIRAVLAPPDSMLPPPEEFVTQVQALAARGTDLLLVYTGISAAYYNYKRLLRRRVSAAPLRDRVRVEHLADSDHLFTLRPNRERLVELVRSWACERAVRSEATAAGARAAR